MPRVRFRGARLERVDLAGGDLKEAKFYCEAPDAPEPLCTVLQDVCVEGTNLAKASFEGVRISGMDFSRAIVTDAEFTNVQFDNVVFPDRLVEVADFDSSSLASLKAARGSALRFDSPEAIPCSAGWRRELYDWMDAFGVRE